MNFLTKLWNIIMNIFKIVLPGSDVKSANIEDTVVDSRYANPKIDVVKRPAHYGIINLNWNSSSRVFAENDLLILHRFPHGYNHIPTVIGNYVFGTGPSASRGILPFSYATFGLILLDADDVYINLKYLSIDLLSSPVPAFTMQIRFYVMAERGHE